MCVMAEGLRGGGGGRAWITTAPPEPSRAAQYSSQPDSHHLLRLTHIGGDAGSSAVSHPTCPPDPPPNAPPCPPPKCPPTQWLQMRLATLKPLHVSARLSKSQSAPARKKGTRLNVSPVLFFSLSRRGRRGRGGGIMKSATSCSRPEIGPNLPS